MSNIRDELLTKNHREDDEAEEGGVMYATEGVWYTVASFEKYLQHLNPKNEFPFQRPKKEVSSDAIVWYDNMVVGERSLGDMMKRISKEANLSRIYTNPHHQTIPSELQPSLFSINQGLKFVT